MASGLPTAIQSVFFTILMPGTVTILLPWLIYNPARRFEAGIWHYLGLLLIVGGIAALLACVAEFVVRGDGTPAIFFTTRLRSLVGEEPGVLIRSALYERVRNPMYEAVLLILYGEALMFQSVSLLIYAVICTVVFHLTVVLLEEPHLRERHPDSFPTYCRTTPRWIPRIRL